MTYQSWHSSFPDPHAGDDAAYSRYCDDSSDPEPEEECGKCEHGSVSTESGWKECEACGGSGLAKDCAPPVREVPVAVEDDDGDICF